MLTVTDFEDCNRLADRYRPQVVHFVCSPLVLVGKLYVVICLTTILIEEAVLMTLTNLLSTLKMF